MNRVNSTRGPSNTSKNLHTPYIKSSGKSPCQAACPVGVDIPRHLRFIASKQFEDALAVVLEQLPFVSLCGRVCTAYCESNCRLNEVGGSVPIRGLKRFVSQKASWQLGQSKAEPSGKRVAIIGSGPAGLTVAYYMAKLGHGVTIFEARDQLGGMLRYGIPDYRLPKAVLDEEIEKIMALGVEVKARTKIKSIAELKFQGYNAIFIGIGAQKPVELGVEGAQEARVIDALTLLMHVNEGKRVNLGDRVAVIGGGNAAVDAARVAIRLNAKDVVILYRRTREEMPAHRRGVEEALLEGVRIEFLALPIKIVSVNNKVRVQCVHTKLENSVGDSEKKSRLIADTEFDIEVDTLITAIGQKPDVPNEFGLLLSKDGLITVSDTMETSAAGVFAGGDAVTGPASVIEAIAAGKRAAISIDRYLGGAGEIDEKIAPWEEEVLQPKAPQPVGERIELPSLPPNERLGMSTEVELDFPEHLAIEQAARCLRCDLPIMYDASKCSGCMTCMLRCSLRKSHSFDLDASNIQIRRLVNSSYEFAISFSDQCDLCGICVRYCPYEALTRQKLVREGV